MSDTEAATAVAVEPSPFAEGEVYEFALDSGKRTKFRITGQDRSFIVGENEHGDERIVRKGAVVYARRKVATDATPDAE